MTVDASNSRFEARNAHSGQVTWTSCRRTVFQLGHRPGGRPVAGRWQTPMDNRSAGRWFDGPAGRNPAGDSCRACGDRGSGPIRVVPHRDQQSDGRVRADAHHSERLRRVAFREQGRAVFQILDLLGELPDSVGRRTQGVAGGLPHRLFVALLVPAAASPGDSAPSWCPAHDPSRPDPRLWNPHVSPNPSTGQPVHPVGPWHVPPVSADQVTWGFGAGEISPGGG